MRNMHVEIADKNITITCDKLPRLVSTVEAHPLPAEWTQEKLERTLEAVFHCYEDGIVIDTPEKLFEVCAEIIVRIQDTFARRN